jgi:hypothetical protein
MSLSINYLEKIQGSEELITVMKELISILLAAINDWPNQMDSLIDYENEVYMLVGEEVNRKKIEEYISSIDYSKNAWVAESLSQLLEIYNYYDGGKPLKEILKEIQEK